MIHLSAEGEPEIYATTKMFGTILENVTMDADTRELDFTDDSKTENTRGAYPIEFIPNTSEKNLGPPPSNIILLTADAFGVLPPIARLTPDQAMYHFLSGYTAKVAGTEIGVTEPTATFSTCFGAAVHAAPPERLRQPAQEAHRQGRGDLLAGQHRLVAAARRASRASSACRSRPPARCSTPRSTAASTTSSSARTRTSASKCRSRCRASTANLLDPRAAWADTEEYDRTAQKLVQLFVDNFAQFEGARRPGREGFGAGPAGRLTSLTV